MAIRRRRRKYLHHVLYMAIRIRHSQTLYRCYTDAIFVEMLYAGRCYNRTCRCRAWTVGCWRMASRTEVMPPSETIWAPFEGDLRAMAAIVAHPCSWHNTNTNKHKGWQKTDEKRVTKTDETHNTKAERPKVWDKRRMTKDERQKVKREYERYKRRETKNEWCHETKDEMWKTNKSTTKDEPWNNRNENVFVRPNGLRENTDPAISCRGPGPTAERGTTLSRNIIYVCALICNPNGSCTKYFGT